MEYVGGGMDYNSGPYNVQFDAGVTSASLNVLINDDNISESAETFNLSINETSLMQNISVGVNDSTTVTIAASDGKYV